MECTKMSEPEVSQVLGKKRGPSKSSVHLWEFLLELLADDRFSSLIMWTRKEQGEFKLRNQEEVAKRWGKLKQRPGMNYDKLSRALRYYYQKNIIKKVSGQRLVYKFVDLPYSYKPVKNLYKTSFPEKKEDEDQLALKCAKPTSEMFHAFSHPDRPRANFVITSTSPNFSVVQEPIMSRPTSHVTLATNGVCFPIVDRAAKHISVPVIMKCGQASELPRCPVYLKPGTIFADGDGTFGRE